MQQDIQTSRIMESPIDPLEVEVKQEIQEQFETEDEDELFSCSHCDKKFKAKRTLNRHEKIYNQETYVFVF